MVSIGNLVIEAAKLTNDDDDGQKVHKWKIWKLKYDLIHKKRNAYR